MLLCLSVCIVFMCFWQDKDSVGAKEEVSLSARDAVFGARDILG